MALPAHPAASASRDVQAGTRGRVRREIKASFLSGETNEYVNSSVKVGTVEPWRARASHPVFLCCSLHFATIQSILPYLTTSTTYTGVKLRVQCEEFSNLIKSGKSTFFCISFWDTRIELVIKLYKVRIYNRENSFILIIYRTMSTCGHKN